MQVYDLAVAVKISMCVCVTEVGRLWGGTRLVTCDLHTSMY